MKFLVRTFKRILLFIFAVLFAYQLWLFGWILWWKWNPPASTSFMSIRLGELQQKNPKAQLKYQWVPYEKISVNLKRAVVASEDDKFMEHDGFDWSNIERALKKTSVKANVSPAVLLFRSN